MGTDVTMKRIAEASPGLKARIAGVFYLLTILMGVVVLFARGKLGLAGDPVRFWLHWRSELAS